MCAKQFGVPLLCFPSVSLFRQLGLFRYTFLCNLVNLIFLKKIKFAVSPGLSDLQSQIKSDGIKSLVSGCLFINIIGYVSHGLAISIISEIGKGVMV